MENFKVEFELLALFWLKRNDSKTVLTPKNNIDMDLESLAVWLFVCKGHSQEAPEYIFCLVNNWVYSDTNI